MARAMWIWMHAGSTLDTAALVAHVDAQRIGEAFVSVPWTGPDAETHRCVAALRGRGVRVAALGGDPAWTSGSDAVTWLQRATASFLFDAVHLDIEPWTRRDWAGRERELLAGLERTVKDVAGRTALPVEVDLSPWLADAHPGEFDRIVRRADRVALMAYRDRAADVLAISRAARTIVARAGKPCRIGVDVLPSAAPAETFADDGRAVLERELAAIEAALAGERSFAGTAVHDYDHWRALA
ncbi:hypothetical protein LG314_10180 [Agrococcus terreus]|uniref:hypothetical protein n=1 Tax=Agrococcus terreus TaxID=574649 RepID=UPI00384C91DA